MLPEKGRGRFQTRQQAGMQSALAMGQPGTRCGPQLSPVAGGGRPCTDGRRPPPSPPPLSHARKSGSSVSAGCVEGEDEGTRDLLTSAEEHGPRSGRHGSVPALPLLCISGPGIAAVPASRCCEDRMSLSCREQGLQAVGVEWAFNKLPSDFPDGLVVGSRPAQLHGTRVRSQVWEDSTHRGTIKPMHPNSHGTHMSSRSHRSEQSVPHNWRGSPHSLQPEKALRQQQGPSIVKKRKKVLEKTTFKRNKCYLCSLHIIVRHILGSHSALAVPSLFSLLPRNILHRQSQGPSQQSSRSHWRLPPDRGPGLSLPTSPGRQEQECDRTRLWRASPLLSSYCPKPQSQS